MPGPVLRERWRTGAAALRGELAASDPHRRVDWVSGQLATRTLATTRLAECWIHTGDVAEAVGTEQEPTDRLEHIARLAWRTLPYAFAREGRELAGPVAFHLQAPSGTPWRFRPDAVPATVIEGAGAELCLVAARRVAADDTSLRGTGPDARASSSSSGPTPDGGRGQRREGRRPLRDTLRLASSTWGTTRAGGQRWSAA